MTLTRLRDKAVPARRQRALAAAIPVFLEAVADVTSRTPASSRAAVG